MVGIFRTGIQTGTKISHVPSRVRFRVVSGHSSHSGKFWPISAEMQIPVGIGFSLILKKKKKKVKGANNAGLNPASQPTSSSSSSPFCIHRLVDWSFFSFIFYCLVLSWVCWLLLESFIDVKFQLFWAHHVSDFINDKRVKKFKSKCQSEVLFLFSSLCTMIYNFILILIFF